MSQVDAMLQNALLQAKGRTPTPVGGRGGASSPPRFGGMSPQARPGGAPMPMGGNPFASPGGMPQGGPNQPPPAPPQMPQQGMPPMPMGGNPFASPGGMQRPPMPMNMPPQGVSPQQGMPPMPMGGNPFAAPQHRADGGAVDDVRRERNDPRPGDPNATMQDLQDSIYDRMMHPGAYGPPDHSQNDMMNSPWGAGRGPTPINLSNALWNVRNGRSFYEDGTTSVPGHKGGPLPGGKN